MRISFAVGVGSALVFLAGAMDLADGQVTPSGGGYLFRMKHTPGKQHRYSMRLETAGPKVPNGKIVQEMPFRWEVVSVSKGLASMRMVFEASAGQKGAEAPALEMKMDSRGKATNTSTGKPFQRLGVLFPAKPLKVGGSFTAKANQPSTSIGMAAVSDVYTFKGIRKVGNRKVAVVAVRSKVSSASVKGGGTGTMLIDVADGYLARYDYRHRFTATLQGRPTTLEQKVTAARR
jgi:hypothetical protein